MQANPVSRLNPTVHHRLPYRSIKIQHEMQPGISIMAVKKKLTNSFPVKFMTFSCRRDIGCPEIVEDREKHGKNYYRKKLYVGSQKNDCQEIRIS